LIYVQVRVDHRSASVSFGTGVGMTQDIIREGPSIQSMPSEQMRFQLINMAVALNKAMNVISPHELKVISTNLQLAKLMCWLGHCMLNEWVAGSSSSHFIVTI